MKLATQRALISIFLMGLLFADCGCPCRQNEPAATIEAQGESNQDDPANENFAETVAETPAETLTMVNEPPKNEMTDEQQKNLKETGFADPILGTKFNCGPEYRYKFDKTIGSSEDLVDFLRGDFQKLCSDEGMKSNLTLFNFKKGGLKGEIDWNAVRAAITTEKKWGYTYYKIEFTYPDCKSSQGFRFIMRQDGFSSLWGCCGI